MITLYGKQYAKDLKESVKLEGCNGVYKVRKNGVYFYTMQDELRAFIRSDGLGPVTATRTGKGGIRYMHSTCTSEEKWMGVPDSYMAQCNEAEQLVRQLYVN